MKTLSTLDFIVIGLYFLGLIVIGLVTSRRQTSEEMYFLGGRRTSWFLAGISVIATLLSTVTFVGAPGEMIKYGVGFFSSLLAMVFVVPVVNRFIIPALMRLPVTTVYDYLERRFGLSTRMLGAVSFVIMRLIWLGLIIFTASLAISEMVARPEPVAQVSSELGSRLAQPVPSANVLATIIIIMGVVTTFYAALGGLEAVIWSDFAQFILLFGGALFIPLRVAWATDSGPGEWWQAFSSSGRTSVPVFSMDPTVRISIIGIMIHMFFWNICTHGADQVAAQRYLSTPSAAAARRSVWVYAISNVAVILLLMFCGMAVFYFNYQRSGVSLDRFAEFANENADRLMPQFIADQLPAGLSGLIVAALLAAAMSSLSSGINSISTVVSTDFLDRFGMGGSERAKVLRAIGIAVLAGVLGIASALLIQQLAMRQTNWNLIEMIERVNHIFVGPLGALFFAGLLSRRVGEMAGIIGFFLGVLTSLGLAFSQEIFSLEKPISFIWIMPSSFLVGFIGALLLAMFFRPPSPEQVAAFTYRNPRR